MLRNVRDLRPYHHTVLVTKIVEILIVLIVSETNGICAHLTDKSHIGIVMLTGNGVTDSLPVLVTAHATERIGLAVKNKALIGINTEGTAAKSRGYLIPRHTVNVKNRLAGIEIGILNTVPEMCLFDNDGLIVVIANADDNALGIS